MTLLRAALFTLLSLIHVSVAQEPSLQLLPATILKALDETVYVSCTAAVENPELVTEMKWVGPNGEDIPNSDGSIITMEGIGGPGKLDLMIRKLQDKDTGLYNCTATYAGNQKLNSGLSVDAYMDINFGDTPDHQTPLIGSESKIRCTPTAKPAPQVDWLKDNIPLKNDDNHIIQQDGVLIKEVSEADEGVYRCRARVPQIGSINYKDIQVEVYIPPVINVAPEDVTGIEKATATFECGATGKPVPTYSWVNKDNEPLDDKEGYYIDTEAGVLTILDLVPEVAGTYRCTASNPAGEVTAEAELMVLTKPKIEEYLNITQTVAMNAEMKCVATGSPLPEIVFKKETIEDAFANGINYDDRIEVEQTVDDEGRRVGILRIRGVVRSDDGLYTCTAKSDGGETQVWGHITVEFSPTFEEQPKSEEWSWNQAPVNLTCLATAIPNATIQWYLRNQEIDANDENLKVLSYGPLGVLSVNPSQNYYGVYTCRATNKHGSEEHDLELKEAHVPGPVASVTVEKKTATTISWHIIDPQDNGGLPIQSFIVQYRLRESSWDESEKRMWTKDATYTLDALQPQETYVFRFAAKNEAGEGEWGGEKVEEMPKRAAPEEPMIYNADAPVIENPYTNEYVLRWKVPLDNGEPIDFFQIMYYQVINSSGVWLPSGDKSSEESKHPGSTTFKIENLNPDTYYKIELRAHNLIGNSIPAEIIIKTAHDIAGPEPSTGGVGTGLIVGIIVIVALVLVLVVDVVCYCTKNVGLTATIVGKSSAKDKDKEAMLEDGKNASDEKHEENGQMKTPKEEEMKPVEQEIEEKVKEATEPTETTPMIQGSTEAKNWILNSKGRNTPQEKFVIKKPMVKSQLQSSANRNRHIDSVNTSQRSNSESHHVDDMNNSQIRFTTLAECEKGGYGTDAQLHSLRRAMENPVFHTSNMRNSKSTPVLEYESDSSVDSTYDIPYPDKVRRTSCIIQSTPPPRCTKLKPPLPLRNPKTRLTSSQEDILASEQRGNANDFIGRHSPLCEDKNNPSGENVVVIDNCSRLKYVISSNEALDRLDRRASKEQLDQSLAQVSTRGNISGGIPSSTYKSPSQSSYSTFYQPVDAPFYLKQSKVAFGVAGYDDPISAQTPRNLPLSSPNHKVKPQNLIPFSTNARKQIPQKMTPQFKRPNIPPPPTPNSRKVTFDKGKSKVKTVTTLYFVERPQLKNLSQSVDALDDTFCTSMSSEDSSSSAMPISTLSSARSLGSLISDSSQRSYNQPTLI